VYTGKGFQDFADSNGVLAPGYMILNRQGRLEIDDSTMVVFPDGKASFSERFNVTLQAPDFDFCRYPFDTQRFYVHLGFLQPKDLMLMTEIEGFSRMGDQLGEEEWVVERAGWRTPSGRRDLVSSARSSASAFRPIGTCNITFCGSSCRSASSC
jgi:hypothetical protein